MLAGRALQVQLDTGSADLWIDTRGMLLENVTNTGLSPYPMVYGSVRSDLGPCEVVTSSFVRDGTVAAGPILLAPVEFGNFSVPFQAFGM